jgi:hypothetical protein
MTECRRKIDVVSNGLSAIGAMAFSNGCFDRNMPDSWDDKYYYATDDGAQYREDLDKFLRENLASLVAEVAEMSKLITAEDIESNAVDLSRLDVAFVFLLRLNCGVAIMTKAVKEKIRDSWCRIDLPDALYQILLMEDDEALVAALKDYQFGGQIKTAGLVKYNLLPSVK